MGPICDYHIFTTQTQDFRNFLLVDDDYRGVKMSKESDDEEWQAGYDQWGWHESWGERKDEDYPGWDDEKENGRSTDPLHHLKGPYDGSDNWIGEWLETPGQLQRRIYRRRPLEDKQARIWKRQQKAKELELEALMKSPPDRLVHLVTEIIDDEVRSELIKNLQNLLDVAGALRTTEKLILALRKMKTAFYQTAHLKKRREIAKYGAKYRLLERVQDRILKQIGMLIEKLEDTQSNQIALAICEVFFEVE